MAGAFGFAADHDNVSIACGERVLLPEVRKAGKDTLIIADGFSCRTQVEETTTRRALHTAQVLMMALEEGPRGPAGNLPEARYAQPVPPIPAKSKALALLALSALVLGGSAVWLGKRLSRRSA